MPKNLNAYVVVFVLRGGETFHLPIVFTSFVKADERLKKIQATLKSQPYVAELLAVRDVQIIPYEVE